MSEPKDPTIFNTPNRETLIEADIDSLGQAVLTLTKELWVLSDRQRITEAVLAKHGLDIQDEIESFQPDEDMKDALKAEGVALIERVLQSLSKD